MVNPCKNKRQHHSNPEVQKCEPQHRDRIRHNIQDKADLPEGDEIRHDHRNPLRDHDVEQLQISETQSLSQEHDDIHDDKINAHHDDSAAAVEGTDVHDAVPGFPYIKIEHGQNQNLSHALELSDKVLLFRPLRDISLHAFYINIKPVPPQENLFESRFLFFTSLGILKNHIYSV